MKDFKGFLILKKWKMEDIKDELNIKNSLKKLEEDFKDSVVRNMNTKLIKFHIIEQWNIKINLNRGKQILYNNKWLFLKISIKEKKQKKKQKDKERHKSMRFKK